MDREVNPAALTVEQLCKLLTAAGGRGVTEESVRQHMARGAPTLSDGRINLVQYAVWLVRELTGG
ncbi:MAG: hypothetical protein JXL80_15435 [Planctomycetes bacterium]|nr:hypothetical protein [Planctomycetota bacterium]